MPLRLRILFLWTPASLLALISILTGVEARSMEGQQRLSFGGSTSPQASGNPHGTDGYEPFSRCNIDLDCVPHTTMSCKSRVVVDENGVRQKMCWEM